MSGTLRISICDPNEGSKEDLKRFLVGMDQVWLEADCPRYDFFKEIVDQTKPDVALIAIDADEEKGLELIAEVKSAHQSLGIIVVSSRTDGQLILSAMRAGASEFLSAPVQIEELVSALDRVSATSSGTSRSKSGSVISVAAASGGVGATSVAVNLACGIARHPEHSVVLVDLDLSLGDADVFLDMIPDYTLLDVSQNVSRLDLALLRKSLTKHESGVYLLPRPIQLNDMETITTEDFKRVLGLLKASFSHLVIDLSKAYNRLDLCSIEMSDHVLLITQLDLPCLRNVVRLLTSLENYEGVSDRVKIVVNRSGLDKSQISASNAEETINREIYWRIPNNYSAVADCRNNGIPLISSGKKLAITQQINELADKLCGVSDSPATEEEGSTKKSWLPFMKKN